METLTPPQKLKGRGAVSNAAGRYEAHQREAFDDGWGEPGGWGEAAEEFAAPLRTTVGTDASRKVIARNQSPDVPFDRSINPYRGCEHGCVYCFARPTHAWLGLSPGLDFESRLFAKPDAAAILSRELCAKSYRPRPIALGTNTDPYQPIERRLAVTRQILQVLAEANHPVTIVTKSNLILRDLDILVPMAERKLARAMISVTTLEKETARKMEPRAPAPHRRLQAIREANLAGLPTGVMAAPMIPAINDMELERILETAAEVWGRCGRLYPGAPAPGDQRSLRGMAERPLSGPKGQGAEPHSRDPRRQAL